MNSIIIPLFILLGMSLPLFFKQRTQTAHAQGEGREPICYVGDRPACELTWARHVSAVFLGTVSNLKEENGAETVREVATVTVEEAFLGVEHKIVTVTSGGNSSGGFPFSIGRRYLIYAKRQDDGTFTVALCGGTKSADSASEDLKYLRSIPSAPSTGTLFGTVFRYRQPPSPNDKLLRPSYPLAGGKISFKSSSHAYEAIVGPDGKFKAENLQPGTYSIDLDTTEPALIEGSGGFTWGQSPNVLALTVPTKGCAQVDFKIDPFHGRNPTK